MKIIRRSKPSPAEPETGIPATGQKWKVLVVDDEPDVIELTHLTLRYFEYEGRGLEIISASSAGEARGLLAEHPNLALALIDVVMESDDAGLELVRHIREELNYQLVRLHIRTGQAGKAPERYVIDHFDIDGYADKTDLTAQRLYTLVRTSLKSYKDLKAIDLNRQGLRKVLTATRELYGFDQESLNTFYAGVLTQVTSLLGLGESGMLASLEGLVATIEGKQIRVMAGIGELDMEQGDAQRIAEASELCRGFLGGEIDEGELPPGTLILPLMAKQEAMGFIYLEQVGELTETDRQLLALLVSQSAGAMENLHMHLELASSYDHLMEILGRVAEYKDIWTGDHIRRVSVATEKLALELGYTACAAAQLGRASRLHDLGKVAIPDKVLQKTEPLTDEEYRQMQEHSRIGAELMEGDRWLAQARQIALGHHERWDGSGYPSGLTGEQIPLETRIVAVVDVYDALTHARPYKPAWGKDYAVEYIEAQAGSHFDPQVIEAFIGLYRRGEI